MCERNPIQCIIPPYVTDELAKSPDPVIRDRALGQLRNAARMRAMRVAAQAAPTLMAVLSPNEGKFRRVHNAAGGEDLPGKLTRSEGDPPVEDEAVNQAFDGAGDTFDFYQDVFGRNSLDDNGMTLISTVHVGEVGGDGQLGPMNNAFWNGEQMAYGDGDDVLFRSFTRSLDVIGHELTHGVESFTSNLNYRGQSGALNEHFADVFGALVRQWKNGEAANDANWLVGAEVLVPRASRRAIRDMENPGTAFTDDEQLGNDPQPAHMNNYYAGPADRYGVHINSGIPNRVFVLAAKEIGGNAWDVTGRIWYDTLRQLTSNSNFDDCAQLSVQVATAKGAAEGKAVKKAWKQVGIDV